MATHEETSKGTFPKASLKLRKPLLSLDHGPTSRTPRAAAQTSVFARFQAHFLPHVSSPPPTTSPAPVETIHPPPPKYIKIRIITWNMNGTLPKGDLATLLGTLPQYEESSVKLNDTEIPGLSLDTGHPYHLVLVAGQECPTLMGLPMGLGGGMKWDWDKEEDDKRKSRPDKGEERKKKEKMREKNDHPSPPDTSITPTAIDARTPSKHHHHFVNGWSNILEDYFSRGIGTIEGVKPDILSPSGSSSFTSLPQLGSPDRPQAASTSGSLPGMADKNAQWKLPPGETMVPKIGPYELLTKERLAGIYLALYVHRDITHLVEGFSQSSVAAGLIGGRLGNKGGVAISLKLNGTSFLFLNAHLAAHEERNAQRLLNMSKIKSELELEDFLPPDDKRKQETDLTERFDHTFLCGDLNFRLEMTRIHAEWLISRKEYAKAQEWDQLRRIMMSLGTNVFTGFQEAPINFPPTFKYDVLRTLKGSKRVRKDARMRGKILSEVEEVTHHEAESSTMDITLKENTSAIAEDDDSSSTSSASISIQSRSAVDNDDEASLNGSDAGAKNGGSNTTPYPGLERTAKHAAHVARRRWWAVFRSTVSLPTPEQLSSKKAAHKAKSPSIGSKSGSIGPASAQEKVLITPVQAGNPTTTSGFTKSDLTLDNKALKLPQPPANVRASTSLDIPLRPSNDGPSSVMMTRSITSKTSSSAPGISRTLIGEASVDVEDKGVYDTSSKRRVPSWCDRILYKSTITLPLSPALETPTVELGVTTIPVESPPVSRRNTPKIGTFFHALKSKKRSSTGQSSSTQIVNSPSTTSKQTTMSTNIESTNPNEPTGMSTANIPTLARLANEAGEAESPTSIPTTPQPYQATDKMSRRITSPIMAPNDSSASTAVRATHNRRRSLSATIPRPNEPIELIGRPLPASASTPPVLPLAFSDGPPSANDATLNKDGSLPSGGSFRGLRRFLSFLPGSFSAAPTPPASAAPPTEEPLAVHGPPLKIFRRGEIRYLEYNTLSDKEMRQLEGRSDHRPVIGQFAVYI